MTTETRLKVEDAQTQLDIAARFPDDRLIVRSCINGFVSLARSITFAMQAESGSETPLARWYTEQMAILLVSDGPLLKFFNEKRVHSVHRGTVVLERTTYLIFDTPLSDDGGVIFDRQSETKWLFDNSSSLGDQKCLDAIELCRVYLAIVERLVKRWEAQRSSLGRDV